MHAGLQKRVQRYGWDKAVDDYDAGWRAQLAPAQERMLDLAKIVPGDRVLDVACGTGLVSFRALSLAGPTGSVVGTDISGEMINRARDRASALGAGNIHFERGDAESQPVRSPPFDAALCALGLMYVPEPTRAVAEMRQLLKPGGRAVAAVWGARSGCGWADLFPITDARVESDVCPLFFSLGTGDSLVQCFQSAGLTEVHSVRIETALEYSTAEAAVNAAFKGGPVALAHARFDAATKGEVHAEYLDSIAKFKVGKAYRIPGEFVVAYGRRP